MPKTIAVDVDDNSGAVSLVKSGTDVDIFSDYIVSGPGISHSKQRAYKPSDFTAAERTTLRNAYNIVRAKDRTGEGV